MGFAVLATVNDVMLRAKEFQPLGTFASPNWTSAEVTQAIADAAAVMNNTLFGNNAEVAQTYLAAHFLTVQNPQLAQAAGPVSGDDVGGVRSQYAVAAAPATMEDYNSSRWGRAFASLRKRMIGSGSLFMVPAPIGPMLCGGCGSWPCCCPQSVVYQGWTPNTSYFLNNVIANEGNLYKATSSSGISAGTGPGPAGTGSAITDGTVTWEFVEPAP